MIIVVPVSDSDKDLIEDFVKVFNLFGPYDNHDLVVVSRPGDFHLARQLYRDITPAKHNFKSVDHYVLDVDGPRGWPQGPNHYWRGTASHLQYERKNTTEPWLWMEIDMTPIKHGWADELEQEYRVANKPFMGNLSWTTTTTNDQRVIKLCQHMVGACIHPPNLDLYSKVWVDVDRIGTAWDVLMQWEQFPHSHDTKLMQHLFRTDNYRINTDENGLSVIQGDDTNGFPDGHVFNYPVDVKKTVLVHGCIDGSLARLVYDLATKGYLTEPHTSHHDASQESAP